MLFTVRIWQQLPRVLDKNFYLPYWELPETESGTNCIERCYSTKLQLILEPSPL